MNMGDNMNIIDDVKAFIFTIWFDKLRGIHREIHRAYNDELFTTKHEIHVWMTWQFPEAGDHTYLNGVSTEGKFMTD